MIRRLESQIDNSINIVAENLIGFTETRYVRRVDDYFIGYLSSQTGCNRGCTFCHLTATGQTRFIDLTVADILHQANYIIDAYSRDRDGNQKPAQIVHWNFMARGEILANKHILNRGNELFSQLGQVSLDNGVIPKFNISTIMPTTLKQELSEAFPIITPTIYYSMYSANEDWRKRWMPAAMPVDDAIEQLRNYQKISRKVIKVHGAFIENENDSANDIDLMLRKLKGLHCEFNIVRYNPYSPEQGVETGKLQEILYKIQQHMPAKIINRVGQDIYASCGTFLAE